jgi:ketosteroid isomerase-like protein
MSERNVEIIRAIYDDWSRGDLGLDRFDPEITMVESETMPGAPAAHGIDAVKRYIESFPNYWAEIRIEPQEYIDAGEQVVVIARLIGRGRRSGAEVERLWAYVWTLREQRALRMEAYADRAEALRVVGLDDK